VRKPVVYICRVPPESLPVGPGIAFALRSLGYPVTMVVPSCSQSTGSLLQDAGIEIASVFEGSEVLSESRQRLSRLWGCRRFRARTLAIVKKHRSSPLLWISGGQTMWALGRAILDYPYLLQLHELYDAFPLRRSVLGYFSRRAKAVVVPESCRAAILRTWLHLPQTPLVLPNKPYSHPRQRHLAIRDSVAREIVNQINGESRIILYQGHIQADRDLSVVAEAVSQFGNELRLVVMGRSHGGSLEGLKRICPSILHVPFVPAPHHLDITSHAHLGLACYDYSSLNNVFCAPNKIWEYAGFGIPVLCSDNPSLRSAVALSQSGKCVNLNDVREITDAIRQICDNYQHFSQRAGAFYDSLDINALVANIMCKAFSSYA
jgi:glycosyltransferase involved in cell wall biosynthesis